MSRNKRGQSSIEYLGTYAWAFMGLLVTLGAMSYFGVFNPNTYSSENCQSGSQIACNDYMLASNNAGSAHFLFQLKNNYGKDIVITGFNVTKPTSLNILPNLIVEPGRTATMSLVTDTFSVSEGSLEDVDFDIEYMRSGGLQRYVVHGDALVEVVHIPFTYSMTMGLDDAQAFCGDMIVNTTIGESCDKPTMLDGAITLDSTSCNGYACRSDCTCIGECGDEIVQDTYMETGQLVGPEECDGYGDYCTLPSTTCLPAGNPQECECV